MYSPIPLKVIELSAFSEDVLTIPPPETRFFLDDGNVTYTCGKCDCVLAENIYVGTLSGKILRCNKCQSYNEIPAELLSIDIAYKNRK